MTGQIPKYGKDFKWERIPGYHPTLAHRAYVLKRDQEWFIRSDKTSERWYIFNGMNRDAATQMGKVWPTLTVAMAKLLTGIEQGFYVLKLKDKGVIAWELIVGILAEDEYWQTQDRKNVIVEPTNDPDKFTFTVNGYGVDRGCVQFRGDKPDVWFHDDDTMRRCAVCGWKAAS
jgi:hypothetical protein